MWKRKKRNKYIRERGEKWERMKNYGAKVKKVNVEWYEWKRMYKEVQIMRTKRIDNIWGID